MDRSRTLLHRILTGRLNLEMFQDEQYPGEVSGPLRLW
jgi:hypothetical protein